jgi:hypothetical protein
MIINKTMEFTSEEQKVIFNAVRQYQMNKVSLTGNQYRVCEEILNKIFPQVYTQKQEQPT